MIQISWDDLSTTGISVQPANIQNYYKNLGFFASRNFKKTTINYAILNFLF